MLKCGGNWVSGSLGNTFSFILLGERSVVDDVGIAITRRLDYLYLVGSPTMPSISVCCTAGALLTFHMDSTAPLDL